jgi:hypothetical protein
MFINQMIRVTVLSALIMSTGVHPLRPLRRPQRVPRYNRLFLISEPGPE